MRKHKNKPKADSNLMLIVIASVALFAGLYFSHQLRTKQAKPQHEVLQLKNATVYPDDFRAIPDFQLTDLDGQIFQKSHLKNHWSFMFFGFTHCPDICPTTLAIFKKTIAELDKQYQDKKLTELPRVIFVSVDPERDTHDRLKEYIRYFNPNFIGLSGALEQTEKLTKTLGVHYARVENKANPENYLIDHSSSIFLINPAGKVHALLSSPHKSTTIAEDFMTMYQAY